MTVVHIPLDENTPAKLREMANGEILDFNKKNIIRAEGLPPKRRPKQRLIQVDIEEYIAGAS